VKRMIAMFVVAGLFVTPAVLAQDNASKARHGEKPASTNMTLSGILTMQVGTVVDVPGTNGTHRSMIVSGNINTSGEKITMYRLTTPDGTRVGLSRQTASAAAARLDDFINQAVTVAGTCTMWKGKPENFVKITSITKDAVQPTADQLAAAQNPGPHRQTSTNLTVSGALTMVTAVSFTPPGTNQIAGAKAKTGQKFTIYTLTTTTGTKVIIDKDVADASPVKLDGFLDESVTIVGTGVESGKGNYKRIHFDKVTSVARNAATQ